MNFSFDLSSISKNRRELMGVAAIMVLLCHAPRNNVMMPSALAEILKYGNVGVDIFLLLSGMGLFYSLDKVDQNKMPIWSWYLKRFIRVLIPYWLIAAPFWIYKVFMSHYSLIDVLTNFFTLRYWIFGDADWFISIIVVCYIFTPPLYGILFNKIGRQRMLIITMLCAFLSMLSELSSSYENMIPFCKAIARFPAFIIGAWIAPYVKQGVKVNLVYIVILSLLCVLLYNVLFPHGNILWIVAMPILIISAMIVNSFWGLKMIASFMGMMSLESYLFNVHLGDILNHISWKVGELDLSYGHYIEYSTVLLVGTLLAYSFYRIDKHIINRIGVIIGLRAF